MSTKKKLAALALLGISSTAQLLAADAGADCATGSCGKLLAAKDGNAQQDTMTSEEQAFFNKLNASAQQMFKDMHHDARKLAMDSEKHGCKAKNECKGQGGCKSDQSSCGSQNSCKGQGGCKVDANKAVDNVNKAIMKKRADSMGS
jgi:hypothetical protein